jgi:hypothetical protein
MTASNSPPAVISVRIIYRPIFNLSLGRLVGRFSTVQPFA